jgi:hypothetical protein
MSVVLRAFIFSCLGALIKADSLCGLASCGNKHNYYMSVFAGNCGNCALCPAGFFCTILDTPTTYNICPIGLSSSAGASVCCSLGYWSSTGSTVCNACPTGSFSITAGASSVTACVACAAGTYTILPGRNSSSACLSCPAGKFNPTAGASCLNCPAGKYNPITGSTSVSFCLNCLFGSFSNAGASICTICPAGTYTPSIGSTSCQRCPGGHYCPTNTSSWVRLNCGRGNYCPDGSGAPTPCPFQVPPTGGWGALQVQGPAFLVETAHCLNHCFWNFTSGDGVLSKC